jgi:unsaturated rhamnogalacturonyl hydrolase
LSTHRRRAAVAGLIATAVLATLPAAVPAVAVSTSADASTTAAAATDWSRAMVDSTMARRSATSLTLAYDQALFLYGTYLVYQRTGDVRYLNYIKAWGNSKVGADGSTSAGVYNDLDNMLAGNIYLILHKETGENRYRLAAQRIWNRLNTGGYPKNADGGFWHATWFPDQLWADGVFMSQPFVARYGVQYNVSATGFNVATSQLITYFNRLRNANGMINHAYDQRKSTGWANRQTGVSPEVWCRAVGWFGMTTIDVLELLPANHPNRAALLTIIRHLAGGYQRFQDPATGRWFELAAKPTLAGNWTETSCSSMFTFTLSRAIERGYLDASFRPVVAKGYQGVLAKVTLGADGRTNISDVVVGTGPGNQAYYLARPRATNDFHGLGAFLIMNEQLTRVPPA